MCLYKVFTFGYYTIFYFSIIKYSKCLLIYSTNNDYVITFKLNRKAILLLLVCNIAPRLQVCSHYSYTRQLSAAHHKSFTFFFDTKQCKSQCPWIHGSSEPNMLIHIPCFSIQDEGNFTHYDTLWVMKITDNRPLLSMVRSWNHVLVSMLKNNGLHKCLHMPTLWNHKLFSIIQKFSPYPTVNTPSP